MRVGASITVKAMVIFMLTALVPVSLATWVLAGTNRAAVETSERHVQAAVLAEIKGETLRYLDVVAGDLRAVAMTLSLASQRPPQSSDEFVDVRAVLASRTAIRAVRFGVPGANVNTIIRRRGDDPQEVPLSTELLRERATQWGRAIDWYADGRGVIVVPVQATTGVRPATAPGAAPPAYLTAEFQLGVLQETLSRLGQTRFEEGAVKLLVADPQRRLIAAYGLGDLPVGHDVSTLAIWDAMPAGAPRDTRVGLVTPIEVEGETLIGSVESVAGLGWAVALWRDERTAYRVLTQMTERGWMVTLCALVGALAVGLFAARAVTRPILKLGQQMRRVGQRAWQDIELDTRRRDELGDLNRSIHAMAHDLEEGEQTLAEETKVRANLSRFMSRELVGAIERGEHRLTLGGQRRAISVLFADVVAFTPLAEQRSAEEVVGLLNELFSILSEVVFQHDGTVDKFIGDCIMAIWGAPVEQPDHASRALETAEDMMRLLETANRNFQEKYSVELQLAIGINSGEAIVGNIGSNKRMEYTVVGDVVNVAARLEGVASPNQVLVGSATREQVGERFMFRDLGRRNLTGRKAPTQVFELETVI